MFFKLNDGNQLPALGFGVFQSPPGQRTYDAVRLAIDYGYRHIDTASLYGNESDVGRAVRDSGILRNEIFITTKLWNSDQGYDRTLRAFDKSFEKLDLSYIDLYLIHWPVLNLRKESWKALVALKASGRVKSIGVSNYTIHHLEELLGESDVIPSVNQVEFSPFLYQRKLLDFCRSHFIQLEAYTPLTRGTRLKDLTLQRIASKHGKTAAQVLIRWCLEIGVSPLPKSNTPSRIRENFEVFDFKLDADDLFLLSQLNEDYRTSWDPTSQP